MNWGIFIAIIGFATLIGSLLLFSVAADSDSKAAMWISAAGLICGALLIATGTGLTL